MCYRGEKPINLEPILQRVLELRGIEFAEIDPHGNEHDHIEIKLTGELPEELVIEKLYEFSGDDVRYIR